jgi:glyoxylase-like metal-dependent hydrolase (beta-lactamase superfamily II)
MPNYICVTCGNQHAESSQPPPRCPICEDERQYVNPEGQAWTTLDELERDHHNVITSLKPGLTEIVTEPKFAIGQRALLVQTPRGNVLWDCVSLIDQATIDAIAALGGISALANSHPHMYASMVAWSHAFGNAPIHLHAANERWVMRPDPVIKYWDGEAHRLDQGVTLYRCGGHFTGSTGLLWPEEAEGLGVLLSSDTMYVARDLRHVSFMYSYPNYIPLSGPVVDSVVKKVAPLKYDRIYSHFSGLVISQDAKPAVGRSAERYKKAIS